MAKKISQLTEITSIDSTVYVPVVQGSAPSTDDYKITPANLIKEETDARIAADKTLSTIFNYTNTETYFVFVGDSRTDDEKPGGYPATMTPYPNILMTLPNFAGKGIKVNAAVWGEDILQAYDGYTTRAYPYRPNGTTIKDSYLFIMIGINDLIFGNDALPTLQNKIDKFIAYCTRATADGFKVIALTSFYTSYATSTTESDRKTFNNAIINNAPNVFLTIDTDTLMGKDTSTIFWADVLHQSHAGSRLIADYINAQFSVGNKMSSYRAAADLPHEIKIINGHISLTALSDYNYANNAAALSAGLVKDMLYHTDGVLKIVI